jgi:uncharacterized protein YjbI with pentapeptide repeats
VANRSWRNWTVGLAASLSLFSGVLAFSAGSAAATVTCPNVDRTTGAVTPLPEPLTDWSGCDLSGANLTSAPMSQDNLSGADLTGAKLDGADVDTVNFTGAILHNASMTKADLDTADLTDADLSGANLNGAYLNFAVLTGADIGGTNLGGVSLTAVTTGGLNGGFPSLMPTGFTLDNGYLIGPEVILAGADLSGLNLSNLNLNGDNLANANLDDTGLAAVNLQNGSLANATLINANLAGANLAGVDIAGADFTGAALTQVSSGGVGGPPLHLPANWFLVGPNGYLVGPGADLEDANLVKASMAGADLIDSNLTGANISLVNLDGADLQNADLSGIDATDTNLAGANLADASMQKAAIYGTALQHASMPSANLTDANIGQSNLQGANLSGATLTGITWTDTICPDGSNSNTRNPQACTATLAAPVANPTVTAGKHGLNGWYTSEVTVAWNWTDGSAAIPAICPTSSTTTGNGSSVTLKVSCTDSDGTKGTGIFAAMIDTTRPLVSITGPRNGSVYTYGHVPHAVCVTSEKVSGVRTQAAAKLVAHGKEGVGTFDLVCSGAESNAGLDQTTPVHLTYAVANGFGGFLAPKPGSALSNSAPITVRFRLTAAAGKPLTTAVGAALAKTRIVRATLQGPGIKASTAVCAWSTSAKAFQCVIKVQGKVRTGKSKRYTITAKEEFGSGFLAIPTGKAANPEVVHFRRR